MPEGAAYQCGRDFKIVIEQGYIYWQGIGENYEEYGADEGYRAEYSGASAKAAADAIFLLSVVDGLDWSEAVQNVFMANLPTTHLLTDLSDLLL